MRLVCGSPCVLDGRPRRGLPPVRASGSDSARAHVHESCAPCIRCDDSAGHHRCELWGEVGRLTGCEDTLRLWFAVPGSRSAPDPVSSDRWGGLSDRDVTSSSCSRLISPALRTSGGEARSAPCSGDLTPREREVLGLVAPGRRTARSRARSGSRRTPSGRTSRTSSRSSRSQTARPRSHAPSARRPANRRSAGLARTSAATGLIGRSAAWAQVRRATRRPPARCLVVTGHHRHALRAELQSVCQPGRLHVGRDLRAAWSSLRTPAAATSTSGSPRRSAGATRQDADADRSPRGHMDATATADEPRRPLHADRGQAGQGHGPDRSLAAGNNVASITLVGLGQGCYSSQGPRLDFVSSVLANNLRVVPEHVFARSPTSRPG